MKNEFCLCKKIFLGWIALLGLLGLASVARAADCAATPAAAAKSAAAISSLPLPLSSPQSESQGYRVSSVRWDPVLRQNWATVVSCGHPEWPGISLRTGKADHTVHVVSAQIREERSPVVRAGDIVELWRQEEMLRIEVTGVAEQSGSVGETIRVRLLRRPGSNQSVEEEFSGIVRGRADVEMQP